MYLSLFVGHRRSRASNRRQTSRRPQRRSLWSLKKRLTGSSASLSPEIVREDAISDSTDSMVALMCTRGRCMCASGCGPSRPSQAVSKNVALMRSLLSHFNVHHPIERDSQETDGVLRTQIVRRRTDENL